MYKPNISATEKLVSTIAGAALAVAGYQKSNTLLGLAGLGLVARGVSGFCPVNAAIGRNNASPDTREALGGSRGVRVESSVTINRPPEEVYAYWRQLDNLPRFQKLKGAVLGISVSATAGRYGRPRARSTCR